MVIHVVQLKNPIACFPPLAGLALAFCLVVRLANQISCSRIRKSRVQKYLRRKQRDLYVRDCVIGLLSVLVSLSGGPPLGSWKKGLCISLEDGGTAARRRSLSLVPYAD